MPILLDTGVGGGGGSGLRLRSPVDVFTGADEATAAAARDTYFQTTNPTALAEFIADQSLAILLRVTGESDAFQTFIGATGDAYDADNWADRTDAVRGRTGTAGTPGTPGARGSLWTQSTDVPTDAIFETLSGVAPQRGDQHLRSTNDRVYTRGATADEWTLGANLTGGRGLTGNPGNDGDPGAPGQGIYASFSVDGATNWHATPTADDLYIRFVTGTARPAEGAAAWGVAIRFVGEDGADGSGGGMGGGSDGDDGTGVYVSFSVNGTNNWHETPTANDLYIRFATGTERPMESSSDWGVAIRFVGADGDDGNDGNDGNPGTPGTPGTPGAPGASVEIEFSNNGTDWHANVASTDTHIRFRVGTSGTWQAKRFVGRDGARGSQWFVTDQTTPQTQTGQAQGDFQIVNDGEGSVYMRTATTWSDTNLNLRGPAGADGSGQGGGTQVAANPAGSDGDDLTRIAIGGTNYNIAGGTGGGGGDVQLTQVGSTYTFAVAGDTRWYATGISPGTIDDDELLYVRFVLLGEPARYRPMRGSTFNGLPDNTAGAALSSSQSGLWQTKDAVNFANLFASVTSAGELLVASDSDWEADDYVELYKLEATGGGGSGGGETPNASEIDADLDHDPPQGETVKAWLQWLAGASAIADTARTQLGTRLDALEHTAVRAAVDDWADVTDHLAAYGNAGLLVSTSDWTTVDAAAVIWQSSPFVQAAGTYRVLAQIPAEFDIDRFRVQWDITGNGAYNFAIPNASNRWAEFTGTVQNGDPNAKYYVLVDTATGATQYRASMPQDGSVNLQHNNGTPASIALPPVVIANPAGSDGANLTRLSVGGTNYVIPSGGTTTTPPTIDITVASAADAAGTTLVGDATITITPGVTFVWRGLRTERNAYRIIRMPATTNTLVSIIGENGEGIEGWARQADNLTWATGPVANNARDPETFTVRVT